MARAVTGSRASALSRLRRARLVALAGLGVLTAGLSAAVAGAVPGRTARPAAPDPFAEPLTAYHPGVPLAGPAGPEQPAVTVSGAS